MRSQLIEFSRFGGPAGILEKDKKYIGSFGLQNPAREVQVHYDHADFFDDLLKLRYSEKDQDSTRREALKKLQDEATHVLGRPNYPEQPLQIDLVTNAAELWPIPFEAALGPDGNPLFVQEGKEIVITRRIRHDFVEHSPGWPARPRVLLISASPTWVKDTVPLEEHKEALRDALKPWIEPLKGYQEAIPNERLVLHVMDKASPTDVEETLTAAQKNNKPFTHVHILAHGVVIKDERNPYRNRYGFGLQTEQKTPIDGQYLLRALQSQGSLPQVVTLAICDGGNQANSIVPYESLAQCLHNGGVPVVVASQLPLTFEGSVVLTKQFYGHLFTGCDVRSALHRSRVALYNLSQQVPPLHDWLSMVAYVELPEGYVDYLKEVRLQAALAALDTAQKWADHIVHNKITSQSVFQHVEISLRRRIVELESYLSSDRAFQHAVAQENAGLLGSANKRLAEFLFVTDSLERKDDVKKALESARSAYREGYQHNLSHHWTGVQYLSLQAVLTGCIQQPGYWHAAVQAATLQHENDPREYWALGSLTELWLLGSFAGQGNQLTNASNALGQLINRVPPGDSFPVESTRRQLNRYIGWWTKANGYFPTAQQDLAEEAKQLLSILSAG